MSFKFEELATGRDHAAFQFASGIFFFFFFLSEIRFIESSRATERKLDDPRCLLTRYRCVFNV